MLRYETNNLPFIWEPAVCHCQGDCTYQTHPQDYLLKGSGALSCFIPTANRGDPRPENTFTVSLSLQEGDLKVVIMDDDDSWYAYFRPNSTEADFEIFVRWLSNLVVLDLYAIESRLVGFKPY